MKPTSIPTAIIVGMTIIGTLLSAAVYFGLRARGEASAPTTSNASADRPIAIEPATPPAAAEAAPVPAVTHLDGPAATSEVARELEAVRADLVARCWQPSIAKAATPAMSKLTFDLTFDAAGHESARGLLEDRTTARSDVTFCVQTSAPQFHIAPQGASVHVSVPFSLPR